MLNNGIIMKNIESHPLYKKIFKEEVQRAQRLMFEYNEKEIWDVLSVDEREELLLSADDDMGPDFADEYAEEEWLRIPDVIKNRIDLSKYKKSNTYVNTVRRNANMYQRGIYNIITDTSKYKNTKEMQQYVAKQIGSSSLNLETLKNDLRKYAEQYPGRMMQFNLDIQQMSQRINPIPDTPSSDTVNPYDMPGGRPSRYRGGGWTGD